MQQQVDFHQSWYELIDQKLAVQKRAKALEDEMGAKKAQIKEIDAAITEHCGEVLAAIEALKRHIEVIQIDIQVELGQTTREQLEQEQINKELAMEAMLKDTPKDIIDKCTKIYRKISRKCHPDRTDNEFLRSLMTRANYARDRHDLKALQVIFLEMMTPELANIVSEFKGSPTIDVAEELLKQEIEESLLKIEQYQRAIYNFDADAPMVNLYLTDPDEAISITLQQLELQENQLDLEVASLKHKLKQIQLNKKYPNLHKFSITA